MLNIANAVLGLYTKMRLLADFRTGHEQHSKAYDMHKYA